MNKRTPSQVVHISIRVELSKPVKVKAYKRVRNGRTEKVRAHDCKGLGKPSAADASAVSSRGPGAPGVPGFVPVDAFTPLFRFHRVI